MTQNPKDPVPGRLSGASAAVVGVFLCMVAGFIAGAGVTSADPELTAALYEGVKACGLLGVIVGGVAIGVRLSRR